MHVVEILLFSCKHLCTVAFSGSSIHALTNSSCREPCNRRYRADSLVSPPPGFPRNSRMFVYGPSLEVITPSSTDLGERSDTLSSPRVSPLPWLGQNQHGGAVHGSVPELVITSPSGKSISYIIYFSVYSSVPKLYLLFREKAAKVNLGRIANILYPIHTMKNQIDMISSCFCDLCKNKML